MVEIENLFLSESMQSRRLLLVDCCLHLLLALQSTDVLSFQFDNSLQAFHDHLLHLTPDLMSV